MNTDRIRRCLGFHPRLTVFIRGYVILCTALFIGNAAFGHPVPRRCHERKITIHIAPAALIIHYRLEVDTLTIIQDDLAAFEDEVATLTKPDEFYSTFTRCYAPIIARNLQVALDGKPLELTRTQKSYRLFDEQGQPLDHVRCDFVFHALWRPAPESRHEVTVREGNYPQELGRLQLALTSDAQVVIVSKSEPEQALQLRPPEQLGPGDDGRLRNLSASFTLRAAGTEAATATVADASNSSEAPSSERHSLLELLLDPQRGFWALLCLAAGFGAVHALTPGHGKTLVAAYLVGERGTVWHACLLGFVTTLTHTSAVLALAVGLLFFFPSAVPADVQAALGLIGGLLVAGLGFWLLMRRLSGGADHVHIGGGPHHDGHNHLHASPASGGKVRVWDLIVLGISGGIVPCWDAIAMLAFAISAQRLRLALPLLLAFSAGLAGVLIAIGVAVIYLKGFAGSRWGQGRFIQSLPLASAVVITAMGLWLCYDSVHPVVQRSAVARERP